MAHIPTFGFVRSHTPYQWEGPIHHLAVWTPYGLYKSTCSYFHRKDIEESELVFSIDEGRLCNFCPDDAERMLRIIQNHLKEGLKYSRWCKMCGKAKPQWDYDDPWTGREERYGMNDLAVCSQTCYERWDKWITRQLKRRDRLRKEKQTWQRNRKHLNQVRKWLKQRNREASPLPDEASKPAMTSHT